MTPFFHKKRPLKEYRMFFEAWMFLLFARFLIFFMPFRKMLPLLGRPVSQTEAAKIVSDHTGSIDLLERICLSVLRACRKSPWRAKCFEQALTARMMLKNRKLKSVIYFGIRNEPSVRKEKLSAHAWLQCSGVVVTGEKNHDLFTVVECFLV